MSLIVLGTVALDDVKTPFGFKKDLLGGSASHFSMSARLFTKVELVAVIGEDFPGRFIDFLSRKGVVIDSLQRCGGKTFHWSGKYEGDLNAAITLNTELGVLASFRPEVTSSQKRIKNVFLANVDPDLQRHFLRQMISPRLVGLDTMNYWINNKRASLIRLLKEVHVFVANDQEARSLSGETNLIKAAAYLRSLGPKMVVIKKGEHGCLVQSRDFTAAIPAYPHHKVIDPTGAGDTFAGGFMGYLSRARGLDLSNVKRAAVYGTVAASFNVEGFGLTRTAHLTSDDLERRLREFRRVASF